ncbi:single-stranded-DNA-specific exonuclease RecJ [Parvularcula marina]|uniref:single-stranded-DNA-specific exonuclease RecJ n=1 Tax=Parvularcula marina TaxID=2292771 RepID=UPI0035136C49
MSLTNSKTDTDPAGAFLGVDNSACGKTWQRRAFEPREAEMLVQRLGLDPLLAEMICARGIPVEEAEGWLNPTLKANLPDPSVLRDMDAAADRIAEAITEGETIGIFGDYDVDGTTSSAIFARYLRMLGAPFEVHLPDRQLEGYGPNLPAFEALKEKGASLIVTVDCGATAHDVMAGAAGLGLDVIVLDHHLMELPAPAARAVVNPNRPDDTSGLTMLSAGGVTFMTLIAVNRALRARGFFDDRAEPKLLSLLDLVALSLVCDVMPLKGLTRVLTRQGLALIQDFTAATSGNPGIRALAIEAGAKGAAQASHFGYSIGPRINAAGRIGHAKTAFDLLMTDDPDEAARLAARLSGLNGVRQGVEAEVLSAASEQAEAKGGREASTPLIVADDGWHPGVIGIVAGRLKEKFSRPAIVISFEGDEGKGSGRSLSGVDLGAAISRAVEEGIIKGGGGHPMAAGLSLMRDQLDAFERFLSEELGAGIKTAQSQQALHLDGALSPAGLSRRFHDSLQLAAPFGNGNPEPRFAMPRVRVRDIRVLKEKHMAVTVEDGSGRRARCIAFGCVGEPLGDFFEVAQKGGALIHLAGRVKPDDWRGGDAAQFQVEDGAFADS